jgi:succinate-acetate transporter protein
MSGRLPFFRHLRWPSCTEALLSFWPECGNSSERTRLVLWRSPRTEHFGSRITAAGVFLLGWTILTFYLMIASLRVSGAVLGVFVALTVTFVLLTIGAFQSNSSFTHAGGWAGIVTAAIAFYASAAGVINETFKKAIVPVFPLAPKS